MYFWFYAFCAFLVPLCLMLAVANLTKSFVSPDGERVEIVNVPEFSIPSGAQVALRGESGSGKTTFLNLIAGILAPDSGRVTIDGAEMFNSSKQRLRKTPRS